MVVMPSSQFVGFLLLAAVLVQTIGFAVTFIYFSNVLSTMKDTFSRSSMSCLMRANLRTFTGWDTGAEEGKDDPCWRTTQQFHLLVEKTMSNRFEKEISSAVKDEVLKVMPSLTMDNQDPLPRPEIAAHVTGSALAKASGVERTPTRKTLGQKIESWESEKGLAFLRNMKISNGELIIPQAGLYYVYSQTYFRHSLSLEEEGEPTVRNQQMLQYVYKKVVSYPDPILLMKNARTTCWSRNAEYGLYSIYQAGVVQLSAGDRVFVTVSNISTIEMDERSSFFGAFLVS
ncbi:hypothetical protein MATL_G00243290 [Megalops atlanticus]|uniref:Tumor necrosis factor ligand superfamily member 10 n=1 Tax=Megalops atlanticus TaxID=7932 RepID=A0A9D3PE99_MEGAT|nr:hypothetical protein MATL_G00243290 [Megalops atlanticus]